MVSSNKNDGLEDWKAVEGDSLGDVACEVAYQLMKDPKVVTFLMKQADKRVEKLKKENKPLHFLFLDGVHTGISFVLADIISGNLNMEIITQEKPEDKT